MGSQLNPAICGEPELAVGAIDDGKRRYLEIQEIVVGGQVRPQQGENLSQQGRSFLASDRIRSNCLERFAGYPLIRGRTPNPTVVTPKPAVSAEQQVLSPGEMPIEHAGDDEFGGIFFVLGPGRSTLRQLLL